jgi:hypothetical protein
MRWLALTFLVASAAVASAVSPSMLAATIRTITTMQAPRMVDDVLLLTYRSRELTRFVGARIAGEAAAGQAWERWGTLEVYSRNEHGVFVLDYRVPKGTRRLLYRIQVDGVWMADPSNPLAETDASGISFSVFEVEQEPMRPLANPEVAGGNLTFVWRGPPGSRVSIVGDHNGWNPFDPGSLLTEVKPGEYAITLPARPGRHYYCFFTEGRKVLDPWNSQTAVDPDGRRVNTFVIPYGG